MSKLSDTYLPDELDAFFSAYGAAFAAGNLDAIDRMCEYPFVIYSPEGNREIANSDFYQSLLQQFRQLPFAESKFLGMQKLRMGTDGAMIIVDYKRYDADGLELDAGFLPFPNGCTYLLRWRADGWKIIGLAERFTT